MNTFSIKSIKILVFSVGSPFSFKKKKKRRWLETMPNTYVCKGVRNTSSKKYHNYSNETLLDAV